MIPLRPALFALTLSILAACEDGSSQRLENEVILLQERLVELETQVSDAQDHANRLRSAVSELEAYVGDVEAAVIDLSATVPRDRLVDAEATVGNVKTKIAEVRARADALHSALRPPYAEGEE